MATRLQTLQYKAIEALNAVVECKDVSFQDRCSALKLVLAHLQARIEQTQPVAPMLPIIDISAIGVKSDCIFCGEEHGALPCPLMSGS